jgi:hypothetical protein
MQIILKQTTDKKFASRASLSNRDLGFRQHSHKSLEPVMPMEILILKLEKACYVHRNTN